jgi:DNA-binding IscR family transcriptional regulator
LIIYSVRGPNGGFELLKDSNKVSMLDIYTAIEGVFPNHPCMFMSAVCSRRCPMSDLLISTNNYVKKYFEEKTLNNLI